MTRIGIVPRVHGVGGMVSFAINSRRGCRSAEWRSAMTLTMIATHCWSSPARATLGSCDGHGDMACGSSTAWTGSTGSIAKHRTPLRVSLRAEMANLLLAFIRRFYADRVVYQSEFIRGWWEDWYGRTRVPQSGNLQRR